MTKILNLYNTVTRQKEPFTSKNGETVDMYCCGPTVYNFAHIGNLRTYIFEDVLKKTLTSIGYKVNHVVNITDVGHLTSDADSGDDKMEAGAQREGKSVWDIARFYTEHFMDNIRDLNISDATVWPKATDHIQEMIDMVKALEDKGFTYKTSDGIYFDTTKFPQYVDFARLDPESLKAGSRIDMGEKRNSTDFALWKFSPKDKKRAMEWDSPWGVGFPGWHIECSAMSLKYLTQPLDIHCGGIDHIRIHHTNEIAQVEASTGKKFCNTWAHGEFLVMSNGKMSKSKGSFITLDTIKERGIDPLAYRLFCFTAHYKAPLTFTWEGLESSAKSLKNLRKLIIKECSENSVKPNSKIDDILENFWQSILDDLNMPRAIAELRGIVNSCEFTPEEKRMAVERAEEILSLDLFHNEEDSLSRVERDGIAIVSKKELSKGKADEIIDLILKRKEARAEKKWELADSVRDKLTDMGVAVKDFPDGTVECEL